MDLRKTQFGVHVAMVNTSVLRVRTESSVYLLGIVDEGGRRYVLLMRKDDPSSSIMSDSDPRIGDALLWHKQPEQWRGHSLTVATLTTSLVQEVARATPEECGLLLDAGKSKPTPTAALALVTGQPPRNDPPPRRVTYPESHVEYAERAAELLRAIARRGALAADVKADIFLAKRLSLALADCVLSLERVAKEPR